MTETKEGISEMLLASALQALFAARSLQLEAELMARDCYLAGAVFPVLELSASLGGPPVPACATVGSKGLRTALDLVHAQIEACHRALIMGVVPRNDQTAIKGMHAMVAGAKHRILGQERNLFAWCYRLLASFLDPFLGIHTQATITQCIMFGMLLGSDVPLVFRAVWDHLQALVVGDSHDGDAALPLPTFYMITKLTALICEGYYMVLTVHMRCPKLAYLFGERIEGAEQVWRLWFDAFWARYHDARRGDAPLDADVRTRIALLLARMAHVLLLVDHDAYLPMAQESECAFWEALERLTPQQTPQYRPLRHFNVHLQLN